jgi:mRNA-degrading endonuclease RelE of RelBE toxin-antitoxin system
MQYEVRWRRLAITQLGNLLRSNRRLRTFLVDDSNRIDEVLSTDPLGAGLPQGEELYATQVGRLRVLYSINEQQVRVIVRSVKLSM